MHPGQLKRQSGWVTIRIALLDLPALLADVLRDALLEEAGVELRVLPERSSRKAILAHDPDIVMVGVSDPMHYADSEFLLRHRPGLGVFAISSDARRAWLHELVATAQPLADVSGVGLRAAVRAAAARASEYEDEP